MMFANDLLAGQRILITGGGTGLGAAMAEGFLELGADVVICGRRKPKLDEAAERWCARFPDRSIATYPLDIRDATDVEAMVAAIWVEAPLTGLVNNAAGNFVAQTHELSPRGFDAIANIVLHGTFYVTHAIGRRWVAEGWQPGQPQRNVISIVASWVRNGSPFVVPSAMSKAGVDVMTKSLAIEWARHGIRLNSIAPGEIPTEGMTNRLKASALEGSDTVTPQRIPAGRVGAMRELQNLATFLMTPGMCDYLTGESIVMDGANSIANGGNLTNLTAWSEEQWQTARRAIEAQDARDKALRDA